nr:hypothetical protein [Mycobacterium sp.]
MHRLQVVERAFTDAPRPALISGIDRLVELNRRVRFDLRVNKDFAVG